MNTATQQFIEDAIKGGWGESTWSVKSLTKTGRVLFHVDAFFRPFGMSVERVLLDPLAWQAVGKTRGWNDPQKLSQSRRAGWSSTPRAFMHHFIDSICDGKTIEEALQALTINN